MITAATTTTTTRSSNNSGGGALNEYERFNGSKPQRK